MKVTVILCTYNRCRNLVHALESVAASEMPPSVAWEVLVVDNNSKDQTRQVAQDFCRRYPGRFRYLFESQSGKSYALNSGIRESRGEILAFMDDDVTVEPMWLPLIVSALDKAEFVGVGGRILPPQDFSPLPWMGFGGPYSMASILAFFDRGAEGRELTESPYGTNMAFRKTMFEKYGGFRTDLGPNPVNEIRGEDTEFGDRIIHAGERLWYEPAAIVHHVIPENRLKQQYFLTWWFNYGRGCIRLREQQPPVWGIPRHYFSIPRRLVDQLPSNCMRWVRASTPESRFWHKCLVWMFAGEVVELFRQLFETKRQEQSSHSSVLNP